MSILSQLNSPAMYAICGSIVAFVALICIVFLVRAWKAGLALGMDPVKLKRVVVSSATFSAFSVARYRPMASYSCQLSRICSAPIASAASIITATTMPHRATGST